jgi:hypothetical protein
MEVMSLEATPNSSFFNFLEYSCISYPEWSETRRYFFTTALEYTIRKVQESKEALKLNGTHQLMGHADEVNSMGENTNIIKKNTEALLYVRHICGEN